MNSSLFSYYLGPNGQYQLVSLFGYRSNSVPGLNILGPTNWCRSLREKIIYLSRTRKLALPLNKYVLVIEDYEQLDAEVLPNLELPLMILYWNLAGILPLYSLDDCLLSGQVSSHGEIKIPIPNLGELQNLTSKMDSRWGKTHKILTSCQLSMPSIDINKVIEGVPDLCVREINNLTMIENKYCGNEL